MITKTPWGMVALSVATLLLISMFSRGSACAQDVALRSDFSRLAEEIRWAVSVAEDEGNVAGILRFLSEDVVYTFPGERPVFGWGPVEGFLRLVHGRFSLRTRYTSHGLDGEGKLIVDRGEVEMTYEPQGGGESQTESMPYEWIYGLEADGAWLLTRLTYGTLAPPESLIPDLPAPTGSHAVGLLNLVLQDREREEVLGGQQAEGTHPRNVAVQLWYPALPGSEAEPSPYQTPSAAEALATFLEWPRALNSFFPMVKTNSVLDGRPDPRSGPFPVLVYNHGYSGFTGVHQALMEELASHGYVVASIGHAFESALFVLPDGTARAFDPANEFYLARLEEANDHEPEAAKDRIIRATSLDDRSAAYEELLRLSPFHQASTRLWAEDSRFVLDILEGMNRSGGRLEGMLDLSRVGAVGHSLGGATSGQLLVSDSRVGAGINIDGFQFGDLLSEGIQKPFLFLAAQRPWAGDSTFVNDLFVHGAKAPAYGVIISGFEHSSFTDLPLFGLAPGLGDGDDAGVRALQIQREVILSFFDQCLKGIPSELLNGHTSTYPELIIVRGSKVER